MNTPHHQEGWVLPIALMGLAVVSAVCASAWRQALHGTQDLGHAIAHQRSQQAAHAQLQAVETAWLQSGVLPSGDQVHTVHSADLGWPAPHWRLHQFTVTGHHGNSRVVLQSTWAQALDEHGHARVDMPAQPWSWREVWP